MNNMKPQTLEEFRNLYPTTWSKMDTNMKMDFEFFIKKVYEAGQEEEREKYEEVKTKWFQRGYQQGKLAATMKERIKSDPDFFEKSLRTVIKALGTNQNDKTTG